jgi:hypothetical protein
MFWQVTRRHLKKMRFNCGDLRIAAAAFAKSAFARAGKVTFRMDKTDTPQNFQADNELCRILNAKNLTHVPNINRNE